MSVRAKRQKFKCPVCGSHLVVAIKVSHAPPSEVERLTKPKRKGRSK